MSAAISSISAADLRVAVVGCDAWVMQLDPRPLNDVEQAVLGRILSRDFQGVQALREQALDVQVVGRCDCGCPSVELEPSPLRPKSDQVGRLAPVELEVAPEGDEPPGQIILFVDDGRLSYLEYVDYSDSPPESWPAIERLSVVQRQ
jgi:hypothetical protein